MIKKIKGIVIKEVTYKETSKIIEVFTESGIISISARGSKRIKSPLFFGTTYLTYAEFCIYDKGEISTLKSVDVIKIYKNTLKDIIKMGAVSYLVSLTTQVYKQNNDVKIYNLLLDSLDKIDCGINPLGIINIVEVKLLEFLGLNINLNNCSICGSVDISSISLDHSGYLCNNCSNIKMNSKFLKLIKVYKMIDIKKIDKLELDLELLMSANKFMDEYYEKYTGLYLKSKEFFMNLL